MIGSRVATLARVIRPPVERRVLVALVVAAFCAYALLSLTKHRLFQTTSIDLTIFDQAVRGYAAFQAPTSPVKGFSIGKGAAWNQLGDHFSPILALLAPLYWIHDAPETLLVAQAALLALAAVPIWAFARRRLGVLPAHLTAAGYLLSWPVAHVVAFDFHEAAAVPLLSALLIERYEAGRHTVAASAAFGLLLVKEDMGLTVAAFGALAVVRGDRRRGAAYLVAGLAWTVLARAALIPAVGGDPGAHWAYHHFGPDVPEALVGMLTDPLGALQYLVTPADKLSTAVLLLWTALPVCLCSPIIVVAVPHLLERMLSDNPNWWGTDFHYNAFTIAIVFCAGVDGAARLARRYDRPGIGPAWAACVCAVALTLAPQHPLARLADPGFYRAGPDVVAAAEAVALVPDGVMVEAANHIGPRLTARTTVLLWEDGKQNAPWVVADTARQVFPWPSAERQRARVAELRAAGYRVVFERDGYVVLHRGQ
ncbi:DUF2079 domain-containing protein [Spongiactinospora gelatinilytica]|uniref:DUF2079 domain-containing protein n=1 Tax=Spongiactinospora gelatinilytica TaxID=2666298 RepID=UPI001F2EE343|nr:DUF2079 domain-containing protein [Spongiactinospora gelatinilytica]